MMQSANQVWIERKEGYSGSLSGNKPVAMFCDIKIPKSVPSRPHVYKWMSIRRNVPSDIVYITIGRQFPFSTLEGYWQQMKAEQCDNSQRRPTNGKRNHHVTD